MKKIDFLTREEEKALARRMRRGDIKARNMLVWSHYPFVRKLAAYYASHSPSMTVDDLTQDGMIALLENARKFDPSRGFRFATYIGYWVRTTMGDRCLKEPLIHGPPSKVRKTRRLHQAVAALSEREGQTLSSEAAAERLGVPKVVIDRVRALRPRISSLDTPVNKERREALLDFLPDEEGLSPEEALIKNEEREEAHRRLGDLLTKLETDSRISERERAIFKAYFGLETGKPLNLENVAVCHHLSRERVRQLIDKVAFILLGGEKKNGKIKLKAPFNPLEIQAAARELYSS